MARPERFDVYLKLLIHLAIYEFNKRKCYVDRVSPKLQQLDLPSSILVGQMSPDHHSLSKQEHPIAVWDSSGHIFSKPYFSDFINHHQHIL